MHRAVRTPLLLFLLALAVRLVVGAGFPEPGYPDSAYYVDVARSLASGHGFTVDFVWIFPEVGGTIPANPVLPIPSNAHWMPLSSVVMVPFIWALGPTTLASNLPFALIGAAMAPLAWAIAKDAGLRSEVAIGAGILTAVPAFALPYMVQPENYALYGLLVALALFLAGRGLKGSPWSFALAGACAGLASLARNEGLLVLGAMGIVFLWQRWRAWRTQRPEAVKVPVAAALGAVALFVAVVAPWYARQYATFGSFSPSTATGKVLFMRDFSEWNSITTPATLDHLLGMGWGPLLATRLTGFSQSILIFVVLIGALVLVPFLVIGAWRLRREGQFSTAFTYAALLLAFCTILVPIHVPGGQAFHAAVGLAPFAYVLALEGAAVVAARIARDRPRDTDGLTRALVGGLVGVCVVMAVWSVGNVHANWTEDNQRLQTAAAGLDAVGASPSDRVMSIDAAGIKYWSGRPGVVLVDDPVETVEHVARAYDVRWLILDGVPMVPLAEQIQLQGTRPSWVGEPAFDSNGVAIYPICLDPDDDRCGTATAIPARTLPEPAS